VGGWLGKTRAKVWGEKIVKDNLQVNWERGKRGNGKRSLSRTRSKGKKLRVRRKKGPKKAQRKTAGLDRREEVGEGPKQ